MGDIQGSVHWTELMTWDVAGAQEFYGKVCGWTFQAVPMPGFDYVIGSAGDTQTVGIMDMARSGAEAGTPPFWMTYIGVDDVDAATKAVTAGGGRLKAEPFDVPGVGRIAIAEDPSGALIGLMTPADQA
ncbi:MAG: VOC family protein [Rhodobacter sp.]|nr:VOC family protein [Rhodobacter sp.]